MLLVKKVKSNVSKKRNIILLSIFLISFIIFLIIYIFRATLADVSTTSIDYGAYRPSASFIINKIDCSGGNSYEFETPITGTDKQWVNVIVRVNGTITSGIGVFGEKKESDRPGTATLCTSTGTTLNATNKSTGAWFRHVDSAGTFNATLMYKIPETGKMYSVSMYKNNLNSTSVDNMVVNASSSTNVFCYKYNKASETETGESCAKWRSNTIYAPKDASSGDFSWCFWSDTTSGCAPVHQLDVNITPKFNVTFLNWDGSIVKSMTSYNYKTSLDSISKPSNPTKASTVSHNYTFKGWSSDVDNGGANYLADDIVYTATYTETLRKYSITFKNYDGTVLSSTSYDYGTAASEIVVPTPTRSGYKFIGWDSAISNVNGDKVYTAVYKKIHTVSFVDGFGKTLSTVSVVDGEDATLPSNPQKSGYTFKAWDKSNTNIKADTTITATWSIINYSLTFNYDGGNASNVSSYNVETNDIKINNPTKEGYTFIGWTGTNLSSLTVDLVIPKGSISNRVYTANYKINQYTVDLDSDSGIESLTGRGTFDFDKRVTIKAVLKEGYNFTGWYDENDNLVSSTLEYTFNLPAKNVKYTAKTAIKKFNVVVEKTKDGVSFSNESNSVNFGSSLNINFTNETGYTIDSVVVDDHHIDFSDGLYQFSNVKSAHKILISYAKDTDNNSIPDKYQNKITYKVVNGKFSKTSSSNDIVVEFTSRSYNKNSGLWDKIKLPAFPEVIPNDGYLEGKWDVNINEDIYIDKDMVYTYTCIYDYKIIKQPVLKSQTDIGEYEVEWQTNFVPIKIEKYNKEDNSLIEVLSDSSVSSLIQKLDEGEKLEFYLRFYYNDAQYIDSSSIKLKRDILLPATGDIGTIYFTIIGLLVVVCTSILLVRYKLNNIN